MSHLFLFNFVIDGVNGGPLEISKMHVKLANSKKPHVDHDEETCDCVFHLDKNKSEGLLNQNV